MAIQDYTVGKSLWKKVSRSGRSGSIRLSHLPDGHYVACSHTSSVSTDTVALTTTHLSVATALRVSGVGNFVGFNFSADDTNDTWYALLISENDSLSSDTITATVITDDN